MIERVLSNLVEASTVEAAWDILVAEMERFDFDRLFYGFTRFKTQNGLGSPDDMLVLSNHPGDYVQDFVDQQMFMDAPMTRWATENTGAKSWSYVSEIAHDLTQQQRKILEFNRVHNVTAGYTISFADSSKRQKGAIGLTARAGMSQQDVDEIWRAHGERINLVNQVAHLRITALPFPMHVRRLSKRQREVLEWVGDGKTMQDIATIMELKPATVEKHLRKAREALDVTTTAQAVLKASLHRQIFITDL